MNHRAYAVIAALLASTGAWAAAAQATCITSHVADLTLTLYQNKLFVPVTINGSPQRLFIDTGADMTVLSSATAQHLDIIRDFDHTIEALGVGGRDNHLYSALVDRLAIGGMAFDGLHLAIADFNMPLADGEQAGGLIGGDLLSRFDLDLDVPGRRIGFWRITGCNSVTPPWQASTSALPLTRKGTNLEALDVQVNGATVQLDLDTGAPFLVLNERDAARAGVPPEVIENGQVASGRGVNESAYTGHFHIFTNIRLGDARYDEVPAVVVPRSRYGGDNGLLGLMFLRQHRVWLSYATNMLFVQNAPAAPQ